MKSVEGIALLDDRVDSIRVMPPWLKHVQQQTITSHTGSWFELSRSAFNHNIACYVQQLEKSAAIAVVIKSNGYGHGLEEIALLCQDNDSVGWLCTSTLSEALRVRALGVTKPILVLAHIDVDPQYACLHNIDLAIHDEQEAQAVSAAVTGAVQVHIKIDTGLSRFGIPAEDAVFSVQRIVSLPHLKLRGVYTHFAVSGGLNHTHVEQQHTLFTAILDKLELYGISIPLIHAAKSVVAAHVSQTRHSLVRLGAGAYGLCQQEIGFPLRQMLTWKARIMHVRTVQAHAYVGYNRTYQAHTTMRIAVLPLGYYEGYPLSLSNKGQVFIVRTQQLVPVVGRVCMNQLMIDVTQVPGITIGDEVELLADRDNIRVSDLARECASNNERELIARLNPLLPRCIER